MRSNGRTSRIWFLISFLLIKPIMKDIHNHIFLLVFFFFFLSLRRYQKLKSAISPKHPHIKIVEYETCTGKNMLQQKIEDITAVRGEGIILRNPDARYFHGFTRNVYKFRVLFAHLILC